MGQHCVPCLTPAKTAAGDRNSREYGDLAERLEGVMVEQMNLDGAEVSQASAGCWCAKCLARRASGLLIQAFYSEVCICC